MHMLHPEKPVPEDMSAWISMAPVVLSVLRKRLCTPTPSGVAPQAGLSCSDLLQVTHHILHLLSLGSWRVETVSSQSTLCDSSLGMGGSLSLCSQQAHWLTLSYFVSVI